MPRGGMEKDQPGLFYPKRQECSLNRDDKKSSPTETRSNFLLSQRGVNTDGGVRPDTARSDESQKEARAAECAELSGSAKTRARS